jgi:hypothetical protein
MLFIDGISRAGRSRVRGRVFALRAYTTPLHQFRMRRLRLVM